MNPKTYGQMYDPPPLDADERTFRIWVCYQVGTLRRAVRASVDMSAALVQETERKLDRHVEQDREHAAEIRMHRATLRHYRTWLENITADVEALQPPLPEPDDEPAEEGAAS